MKWYIITLHLEDGHTRVVLEHASNPQFALKQAQDNHHKLYDEKIKFVGSIWDCGKAKPIEIY